MCDTAMLISKQILFNDPITKKLDLLAKSKKKNQIQVYFLSFKFFVSCHVNLISSHDKTLDCLA